MRLPIVLAAVAALATAGLSLAQIEGSDRGVVPIDSTSDYEVSGVTVDVSAKTADAARVGGWRIAQRKAWVTLSQRLGRGGGLVSDSTLDALVSGIVIENEQIGTTRYVAKLGVLFDRERAGSLLGVANYVMRSPAMVVLPVQWSTGVGTVFEQRTPWQEAWARFRTGSSAIDYIRPSGTGADGLLLNVGQATRPGRGWWRTVLGQYGGMDVLMPTVRLDRQWPGGPIVALFQARHGPDNRQIGEFALKVQSAAGLPQLLDEGVRRLDEMYQSGLRNGLLRTDVGLAYVPQTAPSPTPSPTAGATTSIPGATTAATVAIIVQFDTPGVSAVNAGEAAMRSVPGVSGAATTSLALGGISLMTVNYGGPPEAFRAALEARGWQVFGSGATLRIRRAPQLLPPDVAADNATAG